MLADLLFASLFLAVGAVGLAVLRLDRRQRRASQTGREVHCEPEVRDKQHTIDNLRRRGGA